MLEPIEQARRRLAPYLPPAPLAASEALSQELGAPAWLKLESLQPTGSFKVRPALNAMLAHAGQAREAGVVTSSSGNFAQAAAWAARRLGVDAKIVMMRKCSPYKVERTRSWGADVVFCGNTFESRWETTFQLQRESGRLLLHPYDSEEAIAGDGCIGLELLDRIEQDFTVVVPVSGGGLIAGIASAVKSRRPGCRVIGVQPAVNGAIVKSLEAGRPVRAEVQPGLADALVVEQPGERAFALIQKYVDEAVLVEESEIAQAVCWLAEQQKIVAEPGGAAGVAALLAGKIRLQGQPAVAVISGGNIQPSKLAELLRA